MCRRVFTAGTYNYIALVHELGHAIGLNHPFEGSNPLPAEWDNKRYSIMSYTDIDEYVVSFERRADNLLYGLRPWVNPTTPMSFDIQVAQQIYGAETVQGAGPTPTPSTRAPRPSRPSMTPRAWTRSTCPPIPAARS